MGVKTGIKSIVSDIVNGRVYLTVNFDNAVEIEGKTVSSVEVYSMAFMLYDELEENSDVEVFKYGENLMLRLASGFVIKCGKPNENIIKLD